MKLSGILSSTALAAVIALGAQMSAKAQEITVYGAIELMPIVEKFQQDNPGMTVILEDVPYTTIVEALPVQLEAGEGPDAAIITDLGGLSRYYLDLTPYVDTAFFESDYAGTLAWLRGSDQASKAINGMPFTLTVNGGYANLTLFEQAGVEVPGEGATWRDWEVATLKVAKATNTDFAMEMDRSGHRFASLAISYGAEFLDADGKPVVDEGLGNAISDFVRWHKEGTMPLDLWGAIGGSTHRELFDDFLNANVVFYFTGSWNLNRMDAEVGDLFDWKVVETPCGASSCTAMPGGGALVGFQHTEHPEVVGAFIDYVARTENIQSVVSTLVQIPAAASVIAAGVDYPGASDRTKESLTTFANQIPKMAPAAYNFQGWRFERAMMNALTTRISQVINDELTVEAAMQRIKDDVNLAIEAAGE